MNPLDRPAMSSPPSIRPRPTRSTKRLTIDMPTEDHAALREWATAAGVPGSFLVRELLALAAADPSVRARAEAAALDAQDRRYAVGP